MSNLRDQVIAITLEEGEAFQCGLWEVLWELNTISPDIPLEERLEFSISIVQELLISNKIRLLWGVWGKDVYDKIESLEECLTLIQDDKYWDPTKTDIQIYYETIQNTD